MRTRTSVAEPRLTPDIPTRRPVGELFEHAWVNYWLWHTNSAGNPDRTGLDPVNLSGALALLAHKRQEVVFVALVSFVCAFRWPAGRASARYGGSRSCPGAPKRSDSIVSRVWPTLTTGA